MFLFHLLKFIPSYVVLKKGVHIDHQKNRTLYRQWTAPVRIAIVQILTSEGEVRLPYYTLEGL